MDNIEYIAEASLVIDGGYPFESWMFIWDGEVKIIYVNRETNTCEPFSGGGRSLEDTNRLEQFVARKLKERQNDEEDPEDAGEDPESRD